MKGYDSGLKATQSSTHLFMMLSHTAWVEAKLLLVGEFPALAWNVFLYTAVPITFPRMWDMICIGLVPPGTSSRNRDREVSSVTTIDRLVIER